MQLVNRMNLKDSNLNLGWCFHNLMWLLNGKMLPNKVPLLQGQKVKIQNQYLTIF